MCCALTNQHPGVGSRVQRDRGARVGFLPRQARQTHQVKLLVRGMLWCLTNSCTQLDGVTRPLSIACCWPAQPRYAPFTAPSVFSAVCTSLCLDNHLAFLKTLAFGRCALCGDGHHTVCYAVFVFNQICLECISAGVHWDIRNQQWPLPEEVTRAATIAMPTTVCPCVQCGGALLPLLVPVISIEIHSFPLTITVAVSHTPGVFTSRHCGPCMTFLYTGAVA